MPKLRLLALALAAGVLSSCAHPPPASAQQLKITSPNGINLFSEKEKPVLRLSATGNAPAQVEYSIREVEGDFASSGVLQMRPGGNSLPLDVPHRGLYDLVLKPQGGAEIKTRFGIVFEPPVVSQNSRWGMFSIRFDDSARDEEMARGHRLVGASWARYNLWADAWQNIQISEGQNPKVSFQLNPNYKSGALALKKQGLHLMGEFSMMPRELSSKPDDVAMTIEGGAGWSRVRPKDYRLWNQLVEQTVKELPEIEVWEVWNEPDVRNFWIDTPENFAGFCIQTSRAIKRANPQAKVAVAGITSNGGAFLETLLKNGVDAETDIWSFHSAPAPMRALLKKHGVPASKPVWETETHALLDFDVVGGTDKTFHFLYRTFAPAYETFSGMVDRAGLPMPAALTYATTVQVLGDDSKLVKHVADKGMELGIFQRDKEAAAVWKTTGAGLLDGKAIFKITPLAGRTLELLDGFGRAQKMPAKNADGTWTFPIQGASFLRGASTLALVKYDAPKEPPGAPEWVSNATKGTHEGWQILQAGEGFEPQNSSGNPSLFLNKGAPPEGEDWAAEIPLDTPQGDTYQILLAGLTLYSLVPDIRWSSPFAWSIDGGEETIVDGPPPSYRRTSGEKWTKNQRLNLEEMKFTGNGDVLWELGRAPLKAGKHSFKIRVLEARPSGEWICNIEAIILRSAKGLPAFDAPLKAPPAPPIPAPLKAPIEKLIAGNEAPTGKNIEIQNGDFETPAKNDWEKLNPPGWKRDVGSFVYNGPYESHGGKFSIAFFPDKKQTQTLTQAVSREKIEAALGRNLQVGDKLILRAWLRNYWEEGGVPPKLIALGIKADAKEEGASANAMYAGSTPVAGRAWREVAFVYRVAEDDLALPFWQIILRADAQTPKSMVVWDDVSLSVAPK